jgi:predicted anti-sigma-YlaC factor YlaD
MSTPSCTSVRERAPDLALGALTGPERAEVVAHLDGCPSCQALVSEYASVADALLDLAPEAEPASELAPPVLAAMQPARHRRRRHRVAALVAAATLALTAGTGLTVALVARDGSGIGSTATTSALRSAPMVGAGDVTVGRVVSTGDRPLKLAVSVDYWVPDGHYQLAARNRAGEAAPVGTLEVTNGRGTWTGRATPVGHPVAVELLDQAGNVVCRGRLE